MPFVNKPVAFDSINYLPGFPLDSVYSCNPWDTNPNNPDACSVLPMSLARSAGRMPASLPMQAAMIAAGVAPASRSMMFHKGIVPAQLGGCGCGCKGSGSCGMGRGGSDHHVHGGGPGGWSNPFQPGVAGLGDFPTSFAPADLMAWAQANAAALGIGFALAWFLKRK
jgi:hypothetical protein